MSKELNCKWYFGLQDPANRKGPNNATTMSFKDEDFNSLAREAIQNSMDAVNDTTQPVVVSFAVRSFNGLEYPNFFDLEDHIQGCLDMFPGNENATKRFGPMLSRFPHPRLTNEFGYLRITDSNTLGMEYDPNDPNSGLYKFTGEGIAQNKEGAGGAFGFGKDAFWALSPISTVFVSSKTADNVYFAGLSKLCTHLVNGQELVSNGQYCTDGTGLVINKENLIPEDFRPREMGTSVFVLGIDYIDEEALIKSVLRNFWMAIYRNKLVVNVENTTINKDNLSELMERCFDEDAAEDEVSNHGYNARRYYEIVVGAETEKEGYKYKTGIVPMNGKDCEVKLYFTTDEQSIGRFLFMRSPLMTVKSEKNYCKGADGVFLCDSVGGNKFLREMENYQHNEWTRLNYEARGNRPSIEAQRVLKAILAFVKETVQDELQQEAPETEQIIGLEQVLTITTPKGADESSQKDDIVDPDTFLDVKKKREKKEISKPIVRKPKKTKALFDDKGRLLSNNGGKRKKPSVIPGPVKPGSMKNKSTENENGKTGIYAYPIEVSYRTWSQVDENGAVWHLIRIFSDTEIENALIHVYAVDEEGTPIGLNIVEADGYNIRVGEEFVDKTDYDESDDSSNANSRQANNVVEGVHINANIPETIKVRFNSDIKYSLRINSDKIVSDESK